MTQDLKEAINTNKHYFLFYITFAQAINKFVKQTKKIPVVRE